MAAFESQRWGDAQAAFTRAHALAPSARTFRGLGLASYYLGQYAAARRAFDAALADPRKPLTDEQRRELTGLLELCVKSTGRFALATTPSAAQVEVDQKPSSEPVILLDRGEHTVRVSAEGYEPREQSVSVAGGEDTTLAIELTRVPLTVVAPAPELSDERPAQTAVAKPSVVPPPERSARLWTWVALGAAPVFAGAGAAIWLTGMSKRDEIDQTCEQLRCSEAEVTRREERAHLAAHETWTSVALTASALSLIGAGVLFVLEGDAAPSDSAALSFDGRGAVLKARL